MTRFQLHRRTFSGWFPRVAMPLCLGCLLLLDLSCLEAQTLTARPPSRVLPGGEVNRRESPVWRLAESVPQLEISQTAAVQPLDDSVMSPVEAFSEDSFAYPTISLPASDYDAGWQAAWNVPNMLGDFFGVGTEVLTIRGNELLNSSPTDVFDPASLGMGTENSFLLLSPGGSVVGRQKAADNNSPLPRDRFFVNYNYVSNTSLQDGGVGVHRFTPGWERTFLDEMLSLEVRVPMAVTFDSDSIITGGSSRDQAELGNVYLALKGVLCSSNEVLISAGLGTSLPTADSLRVFNSNGRELVRVENHSVHLLPYFAGAWSDGGFFTQGFLQVDVDLNGNPVRIDNGTGLKPAGDFHDASFLYLDWGAGYWLTKNRQGGFLTGIAPTLELHYNTSLNPTDVVTSPSGIQFGGNLSRLETVNVVLGATLQLANRHALALGYATAIGAGDDEQFDGELRVLLNWYLGGN